MKGFEFTNMPKPALTDYLKRNPEWLRKFLKENRKCEDCKYWERNKQNAPWGKCFRRTVAERMGNLPGLKTNLWENCRADFGCIFWERREK